MRSFYNSIKKGDLVIVKYLNLVSDSKFNIKEVRGFCLQLKKKAGSPSITINALINKENVKITLLLNSPIILSISRV
jgi:ribosomal protein L19